MAGGRFADRVVVVTGAGRGLGRAIALAFAAEGATLALTGRSTGQLEAVAREAEAAGGRALVLPADLREAAQVEALRDAVHAQAGPADVLVNNSGIPGPAAVLWEQDPAAWDETFAVNVAGVFLCCRAFLPAMVARGSGSVLLIGSISGKRPLHGRTPYAASKMALVGLVRTLAVEAGAHGVRVNLISPGPVGGERLDTVMAAMAQARGTTPEAVLGAMTAEAALGRVVAPEEVARAALFLASDDAAGITGEDVNVAAGMQAY